MLVLDKPRPFDGGSISLPRYHRSHLSLFPGAWVYIVVLPGRDLSRQRAELILSTISEECWHDLWRITATMHDRRGLVNDILGLLADLRLNVLAAESSSLERESFHSIELICDAHHYQTPHLDGTTDSRVQGQQNELHDLKRSLIARLLPDLALDPSGEPRVKIRRVESLFRAQQNLKQCDLDFQKYQRGFRPGRGRAQVERLENGRYILRLPQEIIDALGPALEQGSGKGFAYLLVSDTKDRLLRCHFIPCDRQILYPTIQHSERAGAIAAITGALRNEGFNILTMLNRLDEHRRTAETEFILSMDADCSDPEALVEKALSRGGLVPTFDIKIDFPNSYNQRPSFRSISSADESFHNRVRNAPLSSLDLLGDLVNRYEKSAGRSDPVNARPRDEGERARFRIAKRLYAEEAHLAGKKTIKWLFISCAYRQGYIDRARSLAEARGFRVITGEDLDGRNKREGVIAKIRMATHFLGIWTREGGLQIAQVQQSSTEAKFSPSPWMQWEYGVASVLELPSMLAISKELHGDSWKKIAYDPAHFMFDGSSFPDVVSRAISALDEIAPFAETADAQSLGRLLIRP